MHVTPETLEQERATVPGRGTGRMDETLRLNVAEPPAGTVALDEPFKMKTKSVPVTFGGTVTIIGAETLRHECRCKIRMSGLSKVEMSAFIGGRGRYGNGANRLESTRTGPATCAA